MPEDWPHYSDDEWAPPTHKSYSWAGLKQSVIDFMNSTLTMFEPALAIARYWTIKYLDFSTMAWTVTFTKLAGFLHDLHHDTCYGVNPNEIRPEASPSVKFFCGPNAQLTFNYLTFALTLPAWVAEGNLSWKMYMMGADFDETTEMINRHISMA